MKTIALALTAVLMSSNLMAAELVDADENTNRAPVTTDDCALLTENVTLTLSRDVVASYECNEETNIIAFSACHPNGLKTNGTNSNYYTASTEGGVIKPSVGAACAEEGGDTGTLATAAAEGADDDAAENGAGTDDGES